MTLLNPRVDLAFKIVFGSEKNKDLLISFINSVVSEEDQVVDIELPNRSLKSDYFYTLYKNEQNVR